MSLGVFFLILKYVFRKQLSCVQSGRAAAAAPPAARCRQGGQPEARGPAEGH